MYFSEASKNPYPTLTFDKKVYRCAIGRSGTKPKVDKKEGDGATPEGDFLLRKVWYRADRIKDLVTSLEKAIIHENDGWCDDLASPLYNKLVKLPFDKSHEELWRKDNLYDIFVEIGYNDDPPISGKGSAIFLHVASPEYGPTAGCVALALEDLKEVLQRITPETYISIKGSTIALYEVPKAKLDAKKSASLNQIV